MVVYGTAGTVILVAVLYQRRLKRQEGAEEASRDPSPTYDSVYYTVPVKALKEIKLDTQRLPTEQFYDSAEITELPGLRIAREEEQRRWSARRTRSLELEATGDRESDKNIIKDRSHTLNIRTARQLQQQQHELQQQQQQQQQLELQQQLLQHTLDQQQSRYAKPLITRIKPKKIQHKSGQ